MWWNVNGAAVSNTDWVQGVHWYALYNIAGRNHTTNFVKSKTLWNTVQNWWIDAKTGQNWWYLCDRCRKMGNHYLDLEVGNNFWNRIYPGTWFWLHITNVLQRLWSLWYSGAMQIRLLLYYYYYDYCYCYSGISDVHVVGFWCEFIWTFCTSTQWVSSALTYSAYCIWLIHLQKYYDW